jgi:hypothetical protein
VGSRCKEVTVGDVYIMTYMYFLWTHPAGADHWHLQIWDRGSFLHFLLDAFNSSQARVASRLFAPSIHRRESVK